MAASSLYTLGTCMIEKAIMEGEVSLQVDSYDVSLMPTSAWRGHVSIVVLLMIACKMLYNLMDDG
jgi:hypothetical protein